MQTVGFPYNFSLREHLRRALALEPPELALLARWTADLPGWRAALGERVAQLVSLPEPLVAPEARLLDQEQRAGFTVSRLALAVAADLSVPAYLLTPDPPPETAPAVLCLAREPAGKAALAGELAAPDEALGVILCRRGLRVLLPDLPGCGERAGDAGLGATLLAQGDSLVAWQAREALLCLAYLAAQPETPAGLVALVGRGEALLPALLAATLAPNLRAAAFHGSLEGLAAGLARTNCAPEADAILPGLPPVADLPDLLAFLAPQPLLAAAEGDPPVLALTDAAYELQGAGPRCETHTAVPAAEFPALAAEFFSVWLSAKLEP